MTLFWNKGYKVRIYAPEVNWKIWLYDSSYIVDVVIWAKFGNSSISLREVISTSIL